MADDPKSDIQALYDRATEAQWGYRREMCERDTKEARFVLVAIVAVVLFVSEFFEIGPRLLAEGEVRWFVGSFLIGGLATSLAYALAYARERAIFSLMAGPGITFDHGLQKYLILSGFISRSIPVLLIVGILALAVGTYQVVTYDALSGDANVEASATEADGG